MNWYRYFCLGCVSLRALEYQLYTHQYRQELRLFWLCGPAGRQLMRMKEIKEEETSDG